MKRKIYIYTDDYYYTAGEYEYEQSSSAAKWRAKRELSKNEEFYSEFPNTGDSSHLGVLPSKLEISIDVYVSPSFRQRSVWPETQSVESTLYPESRCFENEKTIIVVKQNL